MRCFLLFAAIAFAQQPAVEDAMRMVSEGRLAEADAALQQLSARSPGDADLRYRLGLVLVKLNRLDDAAIHLEQSTALQPDFVFAWLAVGDLRMRQGDQRRAMAAADEARKRAGISVPAWKALAVLRARIGDSTGEADALRNLILLRPNDRASYARLATLLIERRSSEDARQVAESGSRRFPADAELSRLHGLALYGLGRKNEAMDAFLAAMDAAPADDLAHSSIETLLADAGSRLPAIEERLRRYRQKRPESPLGPYLLALTAGTEKDALLRAALKLDEAFWPAWFELHRVLLEEGKRPQAIQALETVVRLNPNHEAAFFALAELYLQAGDRDKARQHRAAHHRLRVAATAKNQ